MDRDIDTWNKFLDEYVLVENDIVFNENATIVFHLHIVFVLITLDRFQKLLLSVVFVWMQGENAKKSFGFDVNNMKTYFCRREPKALRKTFPVSVS